MQQAQQLQKQELGKELNSKVKGKIHLKSTRMRQEQHCIVLHFQSTLPAQTK